MDYETIRMEWDGALATVTLNRPDSLNALNTRMRAEIAHAVKDAGQRARCLALTGAGRAFCSGQDLGDRRGGASNLERVLRDEYEPMLTAIAECPAPTIAAVNGAAAGVGANLALGCDVVIAAKSAVFLQASARIGLMPDAGGTHWLPRRVGMARAMGAALFAEPIGADVAADWGMIWESVPDDAFQDHWRQRAAHLAEGPTEAYRAIKSALGQSLSNALPEQLALEARLQGKLGETRDHQEGVTAFLERRQAKYEGR